MVKNYFKTAWRSLLRGKTFSIINITGLAVGMAGAALILLWLQHELSFDVFHKNKDRIYQVYGLANSVDGRSQAIAETAQPLAPFLQENYPEVEAATRVRTTNDFLFTANNKSFTGIEGCFADPAFLQIFSFPLLVGNKQQQLANVYSISITEKLAVKLFGNSTAIGKRIKVGNADQFTVTGILQDLPSNTSFNFDYILPWDYLKKLGQGWSNESWLSNNTYSYVLLRPYTQAAVFNDKIKNISRNATGNPQLWTHFLFPLQQWHLYAAFKDGKPVGGRITTVRIFGLIALFILFVACINFMNLSTARSEQRAKEVGVRKVAGAGKGLLVGQFLAEAFLTTGVAGVFALLLIQLVLPFFNMLAGVQLVIPYFSPVFWCLALGFIIVTSLLAGSYPAFYLSSFAPVSIFKKQFKKSESAASPRKILVVLQFSFAIILIISALVVRNQVIYAQDRDKGYANNNLLQVNFAGDIEKNYALIKQELLETGTALSVTKTMTGITEGGDHSWALRWQGEQPADTSTTITIFSTDAGLVKTAGLHLLEGRDIDINQYPADSFSVLLNETAVKLMGFAHPLGQLIRQPHDNIVWHVTGVVKDFVEGSPFDRIPPTVIAGPGAWFNTMHIKFNAEQNTADNIRRTETVFKKYNPAYPFDYLFVDQQYARKFENEERTKTMATLFASLAVFISCLGLFGLSAYIAESRVKEIGVRKVLGASVLSITRLLSVDFLQLVLAAICISIPIAWHAMNSWLSNYTYHVNMGWHVFFIAGTAAICIALATISFQSVKAALRNPVKSLKTE